MASHSQIFLYKVTKQESRYKKKRERTRREGEGQQRKELNRRKKQERRMKLKQRRRWGNALPTPNFIADSMTGRAWLDGEVSFLSFTFCRLFVLSIFLIICTFFL